MMMMIIVIMLLTLTGLRRTRTTSCYSAKTWRRPAEKTAH